MTNRRTVLGLLGGGIGYGLSAGWLGEAKALAAQGQNSGSIVNVDPTIRKDAPLTDWGPYLDRHPTPSVDQRLTDPALVGAIDLHAHSDPDSYPRQWDGFEVARLEQDRGMRGLVIKNHYTETAGLAYMTRKYATPLMEVFGGISLDLPTGGVNPQAIRYLADVAGHYGRIVWMPTHDCEHEVKYRKEGRPFVRVVQNGRLLDEVLESLDVIAQKDLTLATGHVSAEEALMIIKEAKKRGVPRMIMTHPLLGPQFANMSIEQLQEGTSQGAFMEIVSGQLILGKAPNAAENRAKVLDAIRRIGPNMTIISSDSGLTGGLNHTDALALAAKSLREGGFTEPELDRMYKQNPAHLVKLPILSPAKQ